MYSNINFDCLEWILKKVFSQAFGIKVGGDICTIQHCSSENFGVTNFCSWNANIGFNILMISFVEE